MTDKPDPFIADMEAKALAALDKARALVGRKPRHIVFGLTAYDCRQHVDNAISIRGAERLFNRELGWETSIIPRMGIADVAGARNSMIGEFLEGEGDELWFVDQDVCWREPATALRLALWPVDVIGGVPRGRRDPEDYPLQFNHVTEINHYTQHPLTGHPMVGGIMRTNGLPAGLLRITRNALEQMAQHYEDRWYWDRVHERKVWGLCEFENRDHDRWSEDNYFCERWRDIDRKKNFVWCDPHLHLGHIGYKKFEGCLADWLRTIPAEERIPGSEAPHAGPPPAPAPVPFFAECAA